MVETWFQSPSSLQHAETPAYGASADNTPARQAARTAAAVLNMIVATVLSMMALGADVPPDQAADDLDQTVQSLVARLDADTRKERVGAQRKLIRLGPRILPFLPSPDVLPGISAREALREIRIYLERQKATESVQPSRVTLHTTTSLGELARKITLQTGNEFDLSALPDGLKQTEASVDYRNTPFWSTVDDLASRFKLQFDAGGMDGRIRLSPATEQQQGSELLVDNSGSVRVSLVSSKLQPAFFRGASHLMRARIAVVFEPRLRPLFLKYSGDDLMAATLSGQPLEPVSPDAQLELNFPQGGKQLQLQSDFIAPLDPAFARASLSGRFVVQTAAGAARITFDELSESQGAARRRGGVTVTLRKVTFKKGRLTVEVAVSYDTGGPAFESHRAWVYQNDVYLETTGEPKRPSGGRTVRPAEYQIERQADGAVAVTYAFDGVTVDPGHCRFVYVAPTLIVDVPVKFEFSDFPVSRPARERKSR